MSDYIVTGKKGDGKSLVCVGKIQDALLAGRRVATNLDLKLEKLLPERAKGVQCFRLPDFPSSSDMDAIGLGSDVLDEDRYGLIVLDEIAIWLNSRDWNDKDGRRADLLKWIVHSRKKRWHMMFICQGLDQIDKQLRTSLADHVVSCRRLDKLRIPWLGPMTKHLLGVEFRPPKIHTAKVRYGMDHNALVSDRWTYRGHGLYPAYDTEQVFDADYPHGLFSYLSPWHLIGRTLPIKYRPSEWVRALVTDSFEKPRLAHKPKLPLVHLLQALPPDERIKHFKRLESQGALS